MARKKFKTVDHASPIDGIIDDAESGREELASELREWADNMEERMSHTEKYEQVSEAADALENVSFDIEVPDCLEGVEVEYASHSPYGRRGPSRPMRRDNIVEALRAAQSKAESVQQEKEDEKQGMVEDDDASEGGLERLDDEIEALQQFYDELEDAISELESVEFPGMY